MRVFLGYGYNDRDRWIEEYVFPLAVALGCEVVHGKAVYGGALSEEVVRKIRVSQALIGFTTRREENPPGSGMFRTHDWVVQEVTTANAQDIPWVEVREEGVVPPGGILDALNAQRIEYREPERAACLVGIAQALRRLAELTRVATIRIGPAEVVDDISPLLDEAGFTCECQTLMGADQGAWRPTPILPIKGGLFVQVKGLAPGELVRLRIVGRGKVWRSNYESLDTVDIQLKE